MTDQTSPKPSSPLPRIACFHGGGSSPSIFRTQCSALQTHLSTSFQLEFFSAPFSCNPGPGVLPFFTEDKYGPYRTWFNKTGDGEVADGRLGMDGFVWSKVVEREMGMRAWEDGVGRVWRLLRERDEEVASSSENGGCKRGVGPWVGVLGFSQGTRVAAGLLLDVQRRKEMEVKGGWEGAHDVDAIGGFDLRFGVLCMGSGKPMESDLRRLCKENQIIKTPTLHVHGMKDKAYEAGKKQAETYFAENSRTVWDVDYHHAMPWHKADVVKLADMIKEIWGKTK